jgi:hypothetical protein
MMFFISNGFDPPGLKVTKIVRRKKHIYFFNFLFFPEILIVKRDKIYFV